MANTSLIKKALGIPATPIEITENEVIFPWFENVPDADTSKAYAHFIESLCHTKGKWAGKSFELIDWQEQIIRDLFGTLKPNGYRQFTQAYIEIPKKQGKSELAAAVALLLCCGDGEERAEVYGCASDRQQTTIVFDVAADMVRMCPALSRRVKILSSQKRIIYAPTNMFLDKDTAEQFSEWANTALAGTDSSFRRSFVSMLMNLTDKEWDLLEKKVLELAAEQDAPADRDVAAAEAAYIRSSHSAQIEASSALNTTNATADEKAV